MSRIRQWLYSLDLSQYADAFEQGDIDWEILPDLDHDVLRELGVLSPGHRLKILSSIKALEIATHAKGEQFSTAVGSEAKATIEGDRRRLTVLFCDLVDSTALSQHLDPEQLGEVVAAYRDHCQSAIHRLDGYIARYVGDGVLAYFGYPRTHEDDAERAVLAGLAIVEAVGSIQPHEVSTLQVRLGIATGLVVAGDIIGASTIEHDAVLGETPNLAARLQGVAGPGQIVVSEATRELLGERFISRSLGTLDLKGFATTVSAYVVQGERSHIGRFEARSGPAPTPMVGRDQELVLLMERWSKAKGGEGQAMMLLGEAGIGKSRIGWAFRHAIESEPCTLIQFQCSSYHTDSAFWPVTQHIISTTDITPDDTDHERLAKLEEMLRRAGSDVARIAPLLAPLLNIDGRVRYGELGLSPMAQRDRTFEALTKLILDLARRTPVLILVEDAHWIDSATLELINRTLGAAAETRVMLMITSRLDNPPAVDRYSIVTQLTLNRLPRDDVEAIIRRIGGNPLKDEAIASIVERSDGVPLFAEELTKTVIETGETYVPTSLHDSLAARLDRTPEAKETAQIAAVIGREFDHELLCAIAPLTEEDLLTGLNQLLAAGLIFRRGAPPRAGYTFKHALVRDAAYESLLLAKRKQVHVRLVEACESQGIGPSDEVLAQHCIAAGELERAYRLLMRAGRAAENRPAMDEAAAHFKTALDVLDRLSPEHQHDSEALETWLALGAAVLMTRGHIHADTVRVFAAARDLADSLEDKAGLFQATHGLYFHYQAKGEFDKAHQMATELVALAEKDGDRGRLLAATRALAAVELYGGRFDHAHELLGRITQGNREFPHEPIKGDYGPDPYLTAHYNRVLSTLITGFPDRALEQMNRHVEDARKNARAIDLCNILAQASTGQYLLRQTDIARALAFELKEESKRQGFGMYLTMGDALANPREYEWSVLKKRNLPTMMGAIVMVMRTELAAEESNVELARDASAALQELDRTGVRWMSAELERLLGMVELKLGSVSKAQSRLLAAHHVAETQGAKWFELRSGLALARLWVGDGRHDKARDLLVPICAWFSEGFTTADLRNARELLAQISES